MEEEEVAVEVIAMSLACCWKGVSSSDMAGIRMSLTRYCRWDAYGEL